VTALTLDLDLKACNTLSAQQRRRQDRVRWGHCNLQGVDASKASRSRCAGPAAGPADGALLNVQAGARTAVHATHL
jgi:hypothetical protein